MKTVKTCPWSWRAFVQDSVLPDCLVVGVFVVLEVGFLAGVIGTVAWHVTH